MTTPPPPVAGASGLQRAIDALTRAMTASTGNWTRMIGWLAQRGQGSATAGAGGHGPPTFGLAPSAQAQWAYRFQQQQRMHTTGMQDAVNAHRIAQAAAQQAHQLAQARWDNQQLNLSRALQRAMNARRPDQAVIDAVQRRIDISNLQYQSQTDLRDRRITAADTTFRQAQQRLNDQRATLQSQYQTTMQRGQEQVEAQAARQQAAAQKMRARAMGAVVTAAGGIATGMGSRFAAGLKDFNSGVDQYGRLVSLYGGFGTGPFTGGYGRRAQRATDQGFGAGLENVATSDTDLFSGMAAIYRQNTFANMVKMQNAAAATAFVSPELGVTGAAQLQAQMGTARAYYAGQMFGLAPSMTPGGGRATPQQTFASLFSQVSPKALGQLTDTQMKAMLAQGGTLQTTLENFGQAAGIGSEGIQAAADYLTLSNRLRARNKNLSQTDVDRLLSRASQSGGAGDKARATIKDIGGGVGEAYLDAQRRAQGALREGKLDSSASYITAAISAANTLIDIRELLKPVMEPLRKFLAGFAGALAAGGPAGVAGQLFRDIPGSGLVKSAVSGTAHGIGWAGRAISGLFGGDSGAPRAGQGGKITQPTASAPGAGAAAAGAIAYAESQLGKPYQWGAEGPDAWDCSSLTQAAYRSIGINLPRTTYQQINVGKDVPVKDAQPGDLLFYPDASHVVMALGNGKVIEAPHTGDVVKIEPLNPGEYGRAKRIVGSVGQLANTLGAGSATGAGASAGSTAAAPHGLYGSIEEIEALAAALASHGSLQQTTATGAAPSTQNTTSKPGSSPTAPAAPSSPSGNVALGKRMAQQLYGWSGAEWDALYQLWEHESNWRTDAYNAASGATGVPQALPGSKMASAGPDWKTNPATQIKWGLGYIKSRYGDPISAWAFWQHPTGSPAGASVHWYRDSAWEIPDDQDARLHKGEMVLDRNSAQTVRQALLRHSLRGVDPAGGPADAGAGKVVHLNFDAGAIQVSVGDASGAPAARLAASQIVDGITADERLRTLMGGY